MANTFVKSSSHLKRITSALNLSLNRLATSEKVRTLRTDANIVSCEIEIPSNDGVTLPELLRSNLHKWESDKAFECSVTGRSYTHREIHRKSRSFSTALLQLGLKRNDVVGIVLPNVPEFPIVYMGMWDVGIIASPVNPIYTPNEIASQMVICGAEAVVTISEMATTIKEFQKSCPKLKSIIVIGESREGCHSFDEMTKVDSKGTEFLKGSTISKGQVALLPFSSGTTGPPKGVLLTHKNILSNILQYSCPGFHHAKINEGGGSQERLVGVIPFFHSFGFTVALSTTLYHGHFMSCLPKFNPQDFIKLVKRHKPTGMHLVPSLFAFMVSSAVFTADDMKFMRFTMSGGARLDAQTKQDLMTKFGSQIFFQEGYGLTETSPATQMSRLIFKNQKFDSIGSTLPATESKIIDVATGKALGPNENGELCIRGPQVMKGYFNNEKATKEMIDSEKWLHTGDIGYYDKDECFYIVDRIKELIKVKGLQVAPAELEILLLKFPGVADAAVIGIPDERAGEIPRAYIVKQENQSVSEAEIQDYINKEVTVHKRLKGGIEFVNVIPRTLSGKILRKELKADYLKLHG